jgi:hypothetical protein
MLCNMQLLVLRRWSGQLRVELSGGYFGCCMSRKPCQLHLVGRITHRQQLEVLDLCVKQGRQAGQIEVRNHEVYIAYNMLPSCALAVFMGTVCNQMAAHASLAASRTPWV